MNWPLLLNSLLVGGATAVLAVGFGLAAALWVATLETKARYLFLTLAVVALALPPFLVTNCWLDLLGPQGALRGWFPLPIYSLAGTVWILALMLWPMTTLAATAAWRRLEVEQFECEPALRGVALLRWLLLPAARGELAVAGLLTFVLALNNFAVPAILQTKVLPDAAWVQFNTQFDTWGALKLSLPLVIAPILLLLWVARTGVRWPRVQGSATASVFRRQLGAPCRAGGGVAAVLLGVCSVGLPLAQIALAKRTWLELPGAVEAGLGAIGYSFWFAALAATAVVFLALVASGGFGAGARTAESTRLWPDSNNMRTRRSALRVMSSLLWLPFFIPGVVLGIALIEVLNHPPLSALYRSVVVILFALAMRYLALAVTATRHAVTGVDRDLTDAATLEGADRWQMLRFVVWPQIAPQVFAAWYVVYLLCLWDVESIVIIVPPGVETLALRIFNFLHYGHAAQVNALCVVLLGLAVMPLAIWLVWQRLSKTYRLSRVTWIPACVLWCFCTGCAPTESDHEAPLRSQFFERAVGIGSRGVGIGEFNKPRSVACDQTGNVFAVDMTGRVQKFSPDGKFLLTWQMPQTDLGKPKGMAQGRDGNILIIEPHYQRVNHFTPEGKLVAQWGCCGTNEGCFVLPRGIAENSRGEFLVSEYMGMERVQRFGSVQSLPLTPALSPSEGERGNRPASFVNTDKHTSSIPPHRAGSETGAPILLQVIGRAGTGAGEFNRAEGMCVDTQDRLYVADSCNHRIQVFSADGKFVRQYGRAGSGLGELSYPYDIAVDARGYQFVCEFGNSRIQVFDAECRPVEIIGGPGSEPGRFANPWGVALDARGNLYVADAMNHRLQKLVRKMGPIEQMRPMAAPAADGASRLAPHASR